MKFPFYSTFLVSKIIIKLLVSLFLTLFHRDLPKSQRKDFLASSAYAVLSTQKLNDIIKNPFAGQVSRFLNKILKNKCSKSLFTQCVTNPVFFFLLNFLKCQKFWNTGLFHQNITVFACITVNIGDRINKHGSVGGILRERD